MPTWLISNVTLFTPSGPLAPGWLRVEDGRIHSLGAGRPTPEVLAQAATQVDGSGLFLLPGFIDLHVHGAMGHEAMDANPDGLRAMARFFATHGVTGFLATTWTASRPAIRRVLDTLGPLVGPIEEGSTLLGFHLEGPYLNPARCGAQDKELIRPAQPDEAREFLETGLVRLIAVAPEYPENLWLIDECQRRGVTVAAGHTDATFEQMAVAVQHGVSQVTHCFNAMSPFTHRAPGAAGAALAFPEIRCELIADTIHVHPGALRAALNAKGPEGVILITDAIRGTGLPEGDYPIDDHRTITIQDNAARLPDGTLAGSVLTLDRAFYNLARVSNRPWHELWATSSLNAARAIGIDARKGSLAPSKDADLVLLNEAGQVQMTMAEGKIIYTSPNRKV